MHVEIEVGMVLNLLRLVVVENPEKGQGAKHSSDATPQTKLVLRNLNAGQSDDVLQPRLARQMCRSCTRREIHIKYIMKTTTILFN